MCKNIVNLLIDYKPTSFFGKVCKRIIPKRMVRLICLSSLSKMLLDNDQVENRLLSRINQMFELAYDDKAMLFPYLIAHSIWGESLAVFQKVHPETKEEFDKLALYIYLKMPSWLQYGERSEILNDLSHLLRFSYKLRFIVLHAHK